MLTAFEAVYGYTPTAINVTDAETISQYAEKYSSWDYLYSNTIPFTASAEGQFSWGHAKLLLEINSGKIADAQLFTDAMDASLPDVVCPLLVGCRLDAAEIEQQLTSQLSEQLAYDFSSLLAQII